IFGGPAGSYLINLLADLRMPVVTTLHTVLKDPAPEYRQVLDRLIELSDRLVVMSHKACELLKTIYGVHENKIAFIHHGIPDMPFIDPNFYKDKFGVEGRKVLLTFGLLSPNKGIETVLRALPEVVKKEPDVVYIILGTTHPHVLQSQGDAYRHRLEQLVRQSGLEDHVIFHNRFVELKELCEFLGMVDVYITPYLNPAQITSGTLAYAMGTGKAVISTPYWYATEMLAEDRGRITPFNEPTAMAGQIIDLLKNEVQRHAMRKRAYLFSREAIWPEVARQYLQLFSEVRQSRARHPRPLRIHDQSIPAMSRVDLPEIKFDHLKILTDDTGILQHAKYTISDRRHGYCTDDNARALVATAMGAASLPAERRHLDLLSGHYLGFLLYAFNEKKGRFRNFMSYSRRWQETIGSEDAHGRALWGLGKAVTFLQDPGHLAMSTILFNKGLRAAEDFRSPRAAAFSLIGMNAYLDKFSGDSEARRIRRILADRLFDQFKQQTTDDWPWLEESLNYANGKLPHALLLCGRWMLRKEMIDMGLWTLRWLVTIQTEAGHFVPIGCHGWYPRGGIRARFDQQPIEANAMVEACVEAFDITKDPAWFDSAVMCFNWFLGQNDLTLPLVDPATGGCRDGLTPDGINQNEGAESSLAWLLSLMTLNHLCTGRLLEKASTNDERRSKEREPVCVSPYSRPSPGAPPHGTMAPGRA
ncbi:MAG: glycosyltransferase family 4 protein, partial [Desulfosarcina sp.]